MIIIEQSRKTPLFRYGDIRDILKSKNVSKTEREDRMMKKGVKFRLYPNKEQQSLIMQTLGCCRLVYNKGLALRDEEYKKGNKIGNVIKLRH